MPCTARTLEGKDDHSGRWQESDKTECGIHLPVPSIAAE
jgi:phosphoadenosine phosphosulfate reductase